jgi:hypothetical protein
VRVREYKDVIRNIQIKNEKDDTMYYKNWYEKLDKEKKMQADEIIEKAEKIATDGKEEEIYSIAHSEVEEDQAALAEFRFVHFLKKSLAEYDRNPDKDVQSRIINGHPSTKDIIKRIYEAGIPAKDIMTLLKMTHFEGIMDVFYRFEHNYMDDLDNGDFPSYIINEVGSDGELTERFLNVYGWLSYLNPENDDSE